MFPFILYPNYDWLYPLFIIILTSALCFWKFVLFSQNKYPCLQACRRSKCLMFCFMIIISSLKSLLCYEMKHTEYLKFRCFDNFAVYNKHCPWFFLFQPTNAQIHITRVSLYKMYTPTSLDISMLFSGSFTFVPY